MHGGALTLAKMVDSEPETPDLIIATSMLDLTTFMALTREKLASVPIAYYFHENQWSYPRSQNDKDILYKRDQHYGFIQFISAMAAQKVYFNSQFHLDSFLSESKKFLNSMRDYKELSSLEDLKAKCHHLPLGLDLSSFDPLRRPKFQNKTPLILWNHRWEYDKNPKTFFDLLMNMDKEGHSFNLALLGQHYNKIPEEFEKAKDYFKDRILVYGHLDSFDDYAKWLWKADIALNTSHHDFFGMSVVESLYCGCFPIFPHRLAYPEHFEKPHRLYKNNKEAYTQLKRALTTFPRLENIPVNKAKDYDWKIMKEKYDNTFEKILT